MVLQILQRVASIVRERLLHQASRADGIETIRVFSPLTNERSLPCTSPILAAGILDRFSTLKTRDVLCGEVSRISLDFVSEKRRWSCLVVACGISSQSTTNPFSPWIAISASATASPPLEQSWADVARPSRRTLNMVFWDRVSVFKLALGTRPPT